MHSPFEALRPPAETSEFFEVEDYLDHLCHPLVERISYAEREVIRTEMRAHIARIVEAHCELGSSVEVATAAALHQFGDPKNIGLALLTEHVGASGKLSTALWTLMNLAVGAITGACLFVGIDCLMHALHMTTNVCVVPDCLIGASIGWLPALSLLRHPRSPMAAAVRTAVFYSSVTAGLTVLAGLASGHMLEYWWRSISLLIAVAAGSFAFGALAGAANSHYQQALSHFAARSGRYLRRVGR